MDAQQWARIQALFSEAVELPPAERAAFLQRAPDIDQGELADVESLLRAHEDAGDFLEVPAIQLILPGETADSSAERLGQRIGPYQLIGKLGDGGMGEVYRAVRADGQYDKQVAIKLVRFGWNSAAMLERFRQERQILAALESPNIARLYDGGTTEDGVPYVVMELIEGTRIDQYCNENRLNVAQRLKIFREVCGAVQYAHQHLVIHRDIKPSNILVTNDGVPKLLDFGIARMFGAEPDAGAATGSAAAPKEATRAVMMTPGYASPEQIRGETITTSTDIYSLGVVLYELLTGQPPFIAAGAAPHELARLICEVQPPTPSYAVAHSGAGAKWPRRRDLDNIVMKALRKEPARRYATADQLGDDIRRYLNGLTVAATPDSLSYRVGSFVRRHSLGLVATALIVAVAITAILIDLSEARVAAANGQRAERRFEDVHQLATSLVFELHDAIRDLPGAVNARRILVERGVKYLDSLAEESNGDPVLQHDLATSLIRLGDVQGNPYDASLGDIAGAERSYAKALKLAEAVYAKKRDDAASGLTLAQALRRHANVLSLRDRLTDARAEAERAVSVSVASAQRFPANQDVLNELSQDYGDLSGILGSNWLGANLSDHTAAFDARRKQLEATQKLLALAPANATYRSLETVAEVMVGDQLLLMGRIREAEQYYQRSYGALQRLAQQTPGEAERMRLLRIYPRLAIGDLWARDNKAALDRYRRSFALAAEISASDPTDMNARAALAVEHANIADGLSLNGLYAEARQHSAAAVAIMDELRTKDPSNVEYRVTAGTVWDLCGEVEDRAGDRKSALNFYQRAMALYRQEVRAEPHNLDARLHLASFLGQVGDDFVAAGETDAALGAYREALEAAESDHLPDESEDARYLVTAALTGFGQVEAALARRAAHSPQQSASHWAAACDWYRKAQLAWAQVAEPGYISPSGFYLNSIDIWRQDKPHCASP